MKAKWICVSVHDCYIHKVYSSIKYFDLNVKFSIIHAFQVFTKIDIGNGCVKYDFNIKSTQN